jgi:hypothetical protein
VRKLKTALLSAAVLAGSVVAPASGAVRQPVAVTVKPASAYGKSLTVTVRAASRPRTPVTIRVTAGGTTLTRTVTTNASGVATWSPAAHGNGVATATFAKKPATASARFTTAGATVVKLSGYAKVSNGVAHYRSFAAVRAAMQIFPKRAGQVTVSLQHRSGAAWVTDQTSTFPTFGTGGAWAGMAQGNRKMTYRYVVKAAGDAAAGTSPIVSTVSFMVD